MYVKRRDLAVEIFDMMYERYGLEVPYNDYDRGGEEVIRDINKILEDYIIVQGRLLE